MPASTAVSRMAQEVASSHCRPKVMGPMQSLETCSPVRPRRVCRMESSPFAPDIKARIRGHAVSKGILIALNQEKLPGCYLHRSHPNDVARVEKCTFVCTPTREEAGPNNNWMAPDEAYRKLGALLKSSMAGRTMYVVPYVMGPPGSPLAKVGVEITDSVYVALNMGIMTRMGKVALGMLRASSHFNRGL